MRTLDVNIEAHLDDGRYVVFQIAELIGPSATYRFTDAPLPIVWGGNTYANVWFSTGEMVLDNDGEVNCTVTFEDVSHTLRGIVFANDMNRFELKVSEVWADATNTLFGQDLTVDGTCDGVKCSGDEENNPICTIQVRGLWASSAVAIGPMQDYTRNCRYQQFKGPQCKYAGVQTACDRLFTTCDTVMLNRINFGGFRWALGPDQKVAWGTGTSSIGNRPAINYNPPGMGEGMGTAVVTTPEPKRRIVGRH